VKPALLLALVLLSACGKDGPPKANSVNPPMGAGTSETFTLVYSAPHGFSDLTNVGALIGTSTDAVDSCYIWYDPVHDSLRLADDEAAKWSDVNLRSEGSAENSQCRITARGSSASGSGTKLTVRVAVTFKRAFAGRKFVYLYAEERQGLKTGFIRVGRWRVPYEEAGVAG
jgi:hypothetical protein